MVTRSFTYQLAETLTLGGIGLSALLTVISTTIRPNPTLASVSTFTGCAIALGYREVTRKGTDLKVLAERDALKISVHRLELSVNDAQNRLERGLKEYQNCYESKLSELRSKVSKDENLKTKYEEVRKAFDQRSTELKETLEECARLRSEALSFDGQKQQWIKKFDDLISEHNREIESLNARINALDRENLEYKARFNNVDEMAKLRAESETNALQVKLRELNSEYSKVASLYNSAVADLKKLNAEYVSEFSELNEAVSKGIPQAFEAVLDSRDQELMRLSGHLSLLIQPQYFDSIGEYDRANRLIKALYESEQSITLDASEIVPYDDGTGFDVFLNLRDRKARGQSFIDALNNRGNEFSILCGCVKDLKFEYDRVNPHRIKTSLVFRKKSAIGTKNKVDKIWIQRDKFSDRILSLLKKPSTRVMGATGQGKGIFVNLLLAVIANQPRPSNVRLHDPVDGSSEDHWKISKSSSGSKAVKKALAEFRCEFDQRKSSKQSTPAILEIFDEIDALAIEDSQVTKDILYCATGIRHTGQKAIFIGQSPNVGKKGWQWADMDSFNCVYVGTSALQAIQNSPILQPKKEKLEKQYQELHDYCTEQNEELGLDEWNAYRFALIVSDGVTNWIEIPNADSIVCDWNKLTTVLDTDEEIPAIQESLACQHINTKVAKTNRDKNGNPISRQHKCKDCGKYFTTQL